MTSPRARQRGFVVAAVGSAVVLAFFLFVDLGGTVTGTLHPLSLLAAAFWAGPSWVCALVVRTRTAALLGGLVLTAVTTAFLVALFRDTHSTAGVGVLTIPVILYALAAAVLAVDRLASLRGSRRP